MVASEERRVQHWRRDGARWTVDDLMGDADLRLATVPDPIPLAAIYEGSGGVSSTLQATVVNAIGTVGGGPGARLGARDADRLTMHFR